MLNRFSYKIIILAIITTAIFYGENAYAQLENPLSDAIDINAGLDEFSAPSVEINILYSGALGSTRNLPLKPIMLIITVRSLNGIWTTN